MFCDGDFWHGRNWRARRRVLAKGSNAPYWIAKIEYNMARDRLQANELKRTGWTVVRVWGTVVVADPMVIARRVRDLLRKRGANRDLV